MSIRRGYWWLAGDAFNGPFETIKEAKADANHLAPSISISIRAMVELERTDEHGNWRTVH